MSSFTKLSYHVIFSTKYRKPVITEDLQQRLYEYIGGAIRSMNGSLVEIGGVADHVHLLTYIPPTRAVSDFIRELKANSSKWVNELEDVKRKFEWQKGYSAFTVSYSQTNPVRNYLRGQKEHHRRKSFIEEYIEFLKRHDLSFRPEYLFEDEHHG